jgi:hypothetical protein
MKIVLSPYGEEVKCHPIMAAKKKTVRKAALTSKSVLPTGKTAAGAASSAVAPWTIVGSSIAQPAAKPSPAVAKSAELLLVCLQDPFDAIGSSSKIVDAKIPASDLDSNHVWRLRAVLEMHPPRFFESWATRGSFTLDLTVNGSVTESAGQWGGKASTFTGTGTCRVMVMRDTDNKIRFSLVSGARHASELGMPTPDTKRFLNADVGFELNGTDGLTAGAVAVISNKSWSRLIAGSDATTKGLAFDGKWRSNLEEGDGDSTAQGTWAFAVMSRADYLVLCGNLGWQGNVVGE